MLVDLEKLGASWSKFGSIRQTYGQIRKTFMVQDSG